MESLAELNRTLKSVEADIELAIMGDDDESLFELRREQQYLQNEIRKVKQDVQTTQAHGYHQVPVY
jgi:hypothetical protein